MIYASARCQSRIWFWARTKLLSYWEKEFNLLSHEMVLVVLSLSLSRPPAPPPTHFYHNFALHLPPEGDEKATEQVWKNQNC